MSSTPSCSSLHGLLHPAAPDGRPRPDAPFGRGPLAARALGGVIALAAELGARLPARAAHRLAVAGGTLEWAARPGKRRTLAVNLGHARAAPPDDAGVRRLVRREIVNEARRSADLLWSVGRPDEMLANVRIEGAAPVLAEIAAGHGVILAGPHIGGWEVAVPVPTAVLDVPVSVLANDDWLAWAVDGIRRRSGLQVVYLTDDPRVMVARLRDGEALLMFAVIVPLAVLPVDARAWVVHLAPPIPAPPRRSGGEGEQAVLQQLADAWSAVIEEHAEQWAAVYPLAWTPA
jgi:lauroyl/myristoyl acyltransferase